MSANAELSAESDYQLLFMGNSHSAANDLPGLVSKFIESAPPGTTSYDELAPGFRFLADRLSDGVSGPLLQSRQWSHVILQAQKYSTSGKYYYPTEGAEEWIRRARSQGTQPILFPEWPRRGNTEEGPRVHMLHLGIASREAACVAPVGLAWEQALVDIPGIVLHAPDGNHANLTGSLLTAYVMFQVITGQPATVLGEYPEIAVSSALQIQLQGVAHEVVMQNSETCAVQRSGKVWEIPATHSWAMLTMSLVLLSMGLKALTKS